MMQGGYLEVTTLLFYQFFTDFLFYGMLFSAEIPGIRFPPGMKGVFTL